jgi:hypothetical protein
LYFNEQPSLDGEMRENIYTKHYKSHKLFKEDPRASRIQIVNDDLEVCNPCGSKTKFHQLAMFCFCILNLPPCLMSQLTHIYPFAICKMLDAVEDNFGLVLRQLMLELRELESAEGMALNISDLPNFKS